MKILVILLVTILLPYYVFGMDQQSRKYTVKQLLALRPSSNTNDMHLSNEEKLFILAEDDRFNHSFKELAQQHAGKLTSLRSNGQTLEQRAEELKAFQNLQTLRQIMSENQRS